MVFEQEEYHMEHQQNTQAGPEGKTVKGVAEQLVRNWPATVGVLFIILGLGWFFSYAFTHAWLTPGMRFALTLSGSLAALSGGIFLMYHGKAQGVFLAAIGSAGSILALWMGLSLYELFSVQLAFCGMLAIVVATTGIAIFFSNKHLAFLATLAAMIIPLLTQSVNSDYLHLMFYVLLVDVGAVAFLLYKAWGAPSLAACIATTLFQGFTWCLFDRPFVYAFLPVFFLLFFVPWFFIMQRPEKKWQKTLPSGIASLFFLLTGTSSMIETFLSTHWASGTFAVLFSIEFFAIHRLSRCKPLTRNQGIIAVLLGLSAFFCAISVMGLEISTRTVFFSAVCLIIACGVAYMSIGFKVPKVAQFFSLFFLIPIVASCYVCKSLQSGWSSGEFWFLATLGATLGGSAYILQKWKGGTQPLVMLPLFGCAIVYALCFIWNCCHNLIPSAALARAIASTLFTVVGVIALRNRFKEIRWAGMCILLWVIGRLLIVEVWKMPTLPRIATFLLIGTLLITTAFIKRKRTELLDPKKVGK